MTQDTLGDLFAEIVQEIQDHLRRGGSVAEAQALYAKFCEETISVITQLEDPEPFIKDIVIALADKFQFHNGPLLKGLLEGTSADQLEQLRAARAVTLSESAHPAWKYITGKSKEIAVIIIALSYRLHVEKKLKRLLKGQQALEGEQRNIQRQEQQEQTV
ncbi:MAG: hypothetical protein RLZZ67_672 [Candidatus Parcubacteria bacterium]|jgi:hypothetical protein